MNGVERSAHRYNDVATLIVRPSCGVDRVRPLRHVGQDRLEERARVMRRAVIDRDGHVVGADAARLHRPIELAIVADVLQLLDANEVTRDVVGTECERRCDDG